MFDYVERLDGQLTLRSQDIFKILLGMHMLINDLLDQYMIYYCDKKNNRIYHCELVLGTISHSNLKLENHCNLSMISSPRIQAYQMPTTDLLLNLNPINYGAATSHHNLPELTTACCGEMWWVVVSCGKPTTTCHKIAP